jgi:hypothetical protein
MLGRPRGLPPRRRYQDFIFGDPDFPLKGVLYTVGAKLYLCGKHFETINPNDHQINFKNLLSYLQLGAA